jgi:hypothetical protein
VSASGSGSSIAKAKPARSLTSLRGDTATGTGTDTDTGAGAGASTWNLKDDIDDRSEIDVGRSQVPIPSRSETVRSGSTVESHSPKHTDSPTRYAPPITPVDRLHVSQAPPNRSTGSPNISRIQQVQLS